MSSAGPSRRGWHRVALWAACQQAWAYRYLLHLVPAHEPVGRAVGTLVHLALMHYYTREGLGVEAPDPIVAMRRAPARLAHAYETARLTFEAYVADRRRALPPEWRVLAVEAEYATTVGGWPHTQRLDLTLEIGGRCFPLDHKSTSGSTGRGVAQEWADDGQFASLRAIGAGVVAPAHGLPFGGVLVNAISTKPPYAVERHSVTVPERIVTARLRAIAEMNAEIAAAIESGRDPWEYRRDGACRGRYGACEFLALCHRGRDALCEYEVTSDVASELEE